MLSGAFQNLGAVRLDGSLAEHFGVVHKKLQALLAQSPDRIRKCCHTKATPRLRVLINSQFFEALSENEILSYAILTGADQLLFQLSPKMSRLFKRLFPDLPLPMVSSGYCVRVLPPEELLRNYYLYQTKHTRRNK